MNARLSCAALLALACQPAWSQIAVEFDKSYVYVPAGASDTIAATHVQVPGLGNYDVRFKFNPATLALDLVGATPSTTDDNTESLTGLYHCKRYGDTTPLFTTVIKPAGQNLVFGGAVEYVFYGISGSNNWKYTASLSDGGKYLLSVVKESATSIYAITGYIPPGQSSMDTNAALRCDKAS
jgi:hypothetical protein